MTPTIKCLACVKAVDKLEQLYCTQCNGCYHYQCVNITSAFYRENQPKLKTNWLCPSCGIVTRRRRRNDNTPASPAGMKQSEHESNDQNVSSDVDISNLLGDTCLMSTPPKNDSRAAVRVDYDEDSTNAPNSSAFCGQRTITVTLDDFKSILHEKLEMNKEEMLFEFKSIIQREIKVAIENLKTEMTQRTNALSNEQKVIKKDLTDLGQKIKILESENIKLQDEIKRIQSQLKNPINNENQNNDSARKKIVLHGFQELYGESEYDLLERLSYMFRDIMNVNLDGYVEELRRIGKRGNQRPLIIELVNKQITRYLLDNRNFFLNTGLSITEYLDEKSLKTRRNLINILREARRDGKHAVLRNNRLIINGVEYTDPSSNLTSNPTPNTAPNTDPESTPTTVKTKNLNECRMFRN
ncbi:uncharacterized protein [Choristoneura fumiferana]|uniref:uncharacterized protein n=1 Tax=Choristoneura fumiferana TaxID=7141 RepID=UPI003D15B10E